MSLLTSARAPTSEEGAPHQIRGSLGAFSTTVTESASYWGCTACSPAIVDAYNARRGELVLDVCEDAEILEHISGIDELKRATDALALDIDWADDD